MAENRELTLVLRLVADQFTGELKKSSGALGEFNKFISDWKVQLTAVGGALLAVAKATANFGEEALKGAQRTGATVEAYTALAYSARLADMDQQQLSVGLKALSVNMVEAATRTGDGEMLFRRLGISATDSNGKLRPVKDVLLDVADAFQKHADGAGKTEVSVKLFAKAWQEFLPWMNQGSQAIRAQNEEAKTLGVTMSEKNALAAAQFNEEIKRLGSAVKGLSNDVGTGLIPFLTHSMALMTDMIPKARGLGDELATFSKSMSYNFSQTRQGQMLMDGFTSLGLGHRKGEEHTPREQFWLDLAHIKPPAPGGQTPSGEMFGPPAPKGEIGVEDGGAHAAFLRELDRYQKNMQKKESEAISKRTMEDLHLLFAGANSMRQDVQREVDQLIEDLKADNARTIEMINQDFAGDTPAEREQAAGRRIVANGQKEFFQLEKGRLAENAQAWVDYHQQVGGSTQLRYDKDLALLTANLAKQLDLTTEQAAKLLTAWQTHDIQVAEDILATTTLTATQRETIELQSLAKIAAANERASDDVVAGWARGMQNYVRQTGNGFNLATDMARQTAQTMEQGFKTFFFDLFEGRVNSLKEVLNSLLNFAKQIISQITAQLVTKQILTFATSFAGVGGAPTTEASFAASGTGFANGGSFRVPGSGGTDTTPVGFWATPGETVDIRTPGQSRGGSTINNISITVHAGGSSQQSGSGAAPNLSQLGRDISRYVEAKLIEEQRPGGLLA